MASNITKLCDDLNLWKSVPEMLECALGGPYVHVILMSLFSALLFYILTRTADEYLCPSLVEVSKSLNMSESLAGVTLVAFGNGAPDVFSAISAIRSSKSSMVFAELLGSGAFVSALVAGFVMIVVPPFTVEWTTFTRDTTFYLGGSAFTFYVFYLRTMRLVHAVSLVGIYFTYIAIVAMSSACQIEDNSLERDEEAMNGSSKRSSLKSAGASSDSGVSTASEQSAVEAPIRSAVENLMRSAVENPTRSMLYELADHVLPWRMEKFSEMSMLAKMKSIFLLPVDLSLSLTIPVLDKTAPQGNWCKALNAIHCFVTPAITVLLFTGDSRVYGVPWCVCTLPISFTLGAVVLCTSRTREAPKYHIVFGLLGFVASAAWIFRTCEILVDILSSIGKMLSVPESIMGLTVLSWGNSLGDLVTNITISKHGYASMAISAAFGGILLDMLLGLGLPYTYFLLTMDKDAITLDWSYAIVPLFAGVVSFIVVAAGSLWFNTWRTSKIHGYIFIAIYAVTVIASCVIAMKEAVDGLT